MNDVINKELIEKINKSIDDILDIPIEKISFESKVPVDSDITDSNKVYKGEVSILFADMRNSTKFTDDNSAKTVVKVYRSFLKTITRAIRVCHGNVRDFIGDGVLAIFSDKEIDGEISSSAEQAVIAGKMICTLIDYCLNPKLKEKFDVVIGYGIGICTGTVLATKVGMRGNEKNPDLENETGTIWIGSCTNYASKFCGVATSGEIVIDKNTYTKQSCKQIWVPTQKIKGDTIYDCFVSSNNHLENETNTVPVSIQTDRINNSVREQISTAIAERIDEYDSKTKELALLSDKLSKKQKELNEKEDAIRKKETGINLFNEKLREREELLNEKYYNDLASVIHHAHCKKAYIVECGEDFWDEQLKSTIDAGKVIGKSKLDVEIELCYALADIYEKLNSWEKAYDYLCIQAKYHSWIHASTVKEYVIKSGHWIKIQKIIEDRILENIPYDLGKSLRECQEVISQLGH